jgi:MFS family permease
MAVLLLGAREPAPPPRDDSGRDTEPRIALSRGYWSFIAAVVLFTLGNSSDAFILLRLSEAGISAPAIALLWSVHHALKMLASYYGGALSDRLGRRPLILAGWILYALVYAGFGLTAAPAALIALFLVYSVYYGCCEPVERALVADLAPARGRGAAMGYYHGAVGLAALPASLVFGGLYQAAGAGTAFLFGAACAIVASAVFAATLPRGKGE